MSIKKQNCLKMGRKIALLATVCALFVACSDEDDDFFVQRVDDEEDVSSSSKKSSTKSSSSEETDILVVASFEDLSVCTGKREGMFAYVKDERKTYVCDGYDWVIDDGEPESSSEVKSSSSSDEDEGTSSSSAQQPTSSLVIVPRSSSTYVVASGTSTAVESSSSAVITTPGGDVGTCEPAKATINRGESTAWKMTKNATLSAAAVLGADFTWTFGEDASPNTSSKHGNMSSDAITYATSGVKTATLDFVYNGSKTTMQCAPLQVNGAPIKGCVCKAASETVDVAVDGTAAWTVTGCTSQGANITTYTWGGVGVTGDGPAATATLAAKGDVIQPTLVVGNDDNALQDVTCPAVKAVDSEMPE